MSKKSSDEEINFELRAIAKSSVFVFIFLVFSKIVAYFYRIILARYFGPEVYGAFSLAVMVSGFFVLFAVLGFDEGLLRFISIYRGKKQNKKIKEILDFSKKTVSLLGIVFGFLMFLFAEFLADNIFHDASLKIFFQIFSISIPFAALSRIYLASIRAYEKVGWYSFLTNFLEGASKLLFLGCLIFLGLGVLAIHISFVFSCILMFVFSYFIFKHSAKLKKTIKKEKNFSKKQFINYSWPLLFTVVMATLFSWADVFFIGFFKETYDVGIYNSAIPIAALIFFIPNLFVQLFAPLINKNYSENKINLIKNLSQQIGKWIFIFNLPLLIVMLFFPGVLINLLFGEEYILATTSLIFLTMGYLFHAQFTPSFYLLNMLGKSKLSLFNISTTLILNIILNIILIPKYGIAGAAFATAFSFILHSLITAGEVYYFIKIIPIRRKMFRIGLVGIFSILIIFLIRKFIEVNKISLILTGVSFLLFYVVLIFLTKSLDKNDFMILKSFKNKLNIIPISHKQK